MTRLPAHKTRIVCTIGPASQSERTLELMIRYGMNVARLNLAHGEPDSHRAIIAAVRAASQRLGRRVALLADQPGPKLRVGGLEGDEVDLERGQLVQLVAGEARDDSDHAGRASEASRSERRARQPAELVRIPLGLPQLRVSLRPGDDVFLDDGLLQLRVAEDSGLARVLVPGRLRSRDGVALPGADLGVSAFTGRDRELLAFALREGVDAIGVSFVQGPEDITAVREASAEMGRDPFIIAKIERSQALERIDTILETADGLMVARGDLGVNIPIERIAVAQKLIIDRANVAGRPVITATQMLESMTAQRRPTRAEVTDVANAILDGTDCVMLSEETAMGRYPTEAVATMSRVARITERELRTTRRPASDSTSVRGVLAEEAAVTAERLKARYIIVPTDGGITARAVARLRPDSWIVAFSPSHETCQRLQFSRGIHPVHVPEAAGVAQAGTPDLSRGVPVTCGEVDWHGIAGRWFSDRRLPAGLAVMIQGGNRLEVIELPGET